MPKSHLSRTRSFLDTLNRTQHQQPAIYEWFEIGDSISTRCEDVMPEDAGYLRACIELNRKSKGAAIAKITELPERETRTHERHTTCHCQPSTTATATATRCTSNR